ncbi:hypothetical protein KQI65_06965 [bacterium]|nr:hypothetical protein [bacterium]
MFARIFEQESRKIVCSITRLPRKSEVEYREAFDILFSLFGVLVAAIVLLISKPGSYGERWPKLTRVVCWVLIVVLTPFLIYNIVLSFIG